MGAAHGCAGSRTGHAGKRYMRGVGEVGEWAVEGRGCGVGEGDGGWRQMAAEEHARRRSMRGWQAGMAPVRPPPTAHTPHAPSRRAWSNSPRSAHVARSCSMMSGAAMPQRLSRSLCAHTSTHADHGPCALLSSPLSPPPCSPPLGSRHAPTRRAASPSGALPDVR
eukprot:364637-Chlamydomonas_euryale.AAC.19